MASVCDNCGESTVDIFYMSDVKNYSDSDFQYCESCYSKGLPRCQLCKKYPQGYYGRSRGDIFSICYKCKERCGDYSS
jgi:hypothetical protein